MPEATLNPYLTFNGDCREAMEFYQNCLGGKLTMQTFGEAPVGAKDEQKHLIMHAQLENDRLSFMASDAMPGMPFIKGTNVSMSISGTDGQKLREMFERLRDGGTVTMELGKQFWGDIFGMITDKFGVYWMVNITEKKS